MISNLKKEEEMAIFIWSPFNLNNVISIKKRMCDDNDTLSSGIKWSIT